MKKKILSALLVIVMFLCSTSMNENALDLFTIKASAAYENTHANTGNYRSDIIGIAKTQIGYTEGSNNDNKYGAYFNHNYVEWCAYFVSWCARQANIPTSVLKTSSRAGHASSCFNIPVVNHTGACYEQSGCDTNLNYIPQPGDLFFTKTWSHVGLVYYVEGDYFYTIEGNSNNSGSSNGVGVFSLRRKISDYYFGVPNYGDSSHAIDPNYSKNYTTYLKNPSGKTTVYSSCGVVASGHYISGNDPVTIHEVYTDGCCKVSYTTDSGATRTYYAKISDFTPAYRCTGYRIEYDCNKENGKFYDSNTFDLTITPQINGRDAYDDEIVSIVLKVKCPDGSVIINDYGKTKTKTLGLNGGDPGTYKFYAYVETKYGSYTGSEYDRCVSLTMSGTSLSSYYFTTDDVLYRRIRFVGLNTYLTEDTDENAVSRKRESNDAQIWKLIKNSDNSYTIVSLASGKALDVYRGLYYRGINVSTYSLQYSDNQKWKFCKNGDEQWFLRALSSNSAVLDVDGGFGADNTNVALWPFNGGNAQKIELVYPYMITYNANGGSGAPSAQYKDYNANITLSSSKPTRSGYTFLGWSTNSSATSASYSVGASYSSNADLTLYAVWQNNTSSMAVNSSNSAWISTCGEMKYYTFTPATSGKYVIYSTGSEDTKVYLYNANWSELDSDDDGGDGNNFRLEYNLTADTKYTFGIQYYNSSKTGTIPFKFGKVYTVSYNANNGSGAPSAQRKDYGKALTLSGSVPIRTGYVFKGWGTSSSATGATYQPGDTYSAEADVTLYAVWHAHSYSSMVTKTATCTTTGIRTYICNGCSNSYTETISATGHKWITATCTAPKTCTVCDATDGNALGHTPGLAATCTTDQTCTVCGEVLAAKCGHDYTSVVSTPTCIAKGYTTYTCTCGDSYVGDYVNAKGHSYRGVITTAPDCTAKGVKTFTCSDCKDTYTEDVTALGHKETIIPAVPATCIETGMTQGKKCSVCGVILVAQTKIPIVAHTDENADGRCDHCDTQLSIAAMKGDLDDDGQITPADARIVLRAAVGLDKLTDSQKTIADINRDGMITPSDARSVLRCAVGLDTF